MRIKVIIMINQTHLQYKINININRKYSVGSFPLLLLILKCFPFNSYLYTCTSNFLNLGSWAHPITSTRGEFTICSTNSTY